MSNAFIRPLHDATPASMAVEAALSRHGDFMEAMLAAGAIMAHADGEMAGAERRKILALVRENPVLSIFSREAIVEEMSTHEANYRLDPEVAHLLAREKLVRVAEDRRLAHLILNACRAILAADGIAHPSEYRALAEIRGMLGFEREAALRPAAGTWPTR